VIAEIDAPEYQQDLNQARATLTRAGTQVTLMNAKVTTARADADAAQAEVKQSEAEVVKATANREFREKQYERVKELFKLKSIDERLVDEKEKEQEAARGAELSARSAVLTAKAQAEAAQARVGQATAEVEDAKAEVQVASSRVDRAAVFVAYTQIKSPYTGVVTRRTNHVGDFIRSADEGATTPLLSVARIDVMRVVVMVPEAEAAYTERGNAAVVEVDAIADKQFHAKVARISNSEDRTTRSMRTEIDLKNDSGLLRDGMFGRATIDLKNAPNVVTVPSSAVVKHDRKSAVFVVRDGQAHSHPVKTGRDDGVRIEIVSGLTGDEEVVQTPGGDLAEGTPVEAEKSDEKKTGHSPREAAGAGNGRKR
jgi:RND family efflux transporter MFP subunit